jgi:hypothetical protein
MWPITTEDFKFCALLACYAVYSGNSVPTFGENLSVSSSRIKKSNNGSLSYTSGPFKIGSKGCSEASVRKCHCTPCNNPEERTYNLIRGGSL